MKRIAAAVLTAMLILSLAVCAVAEETEEAQGQNATATPDADWNLPETIGMTDAATSVFEKAVSSLTGIRYEPVGYLAEKDGVYCILCRAAAVYPDAKPYYALVYVDEEGVRNIWDIWMGAHAEKKEG